MRRSVAALEVDAQEEHKETSDTHFENGNAEELSKLEISTTAPEGGGRGTLKRNEEQPLTGLC